LPVYVRLRSEPRKRKRLVLEHGVRVGLVGVGVLIAERHLYARNAPRAAKHHGNFLPQKLFARVRARVEPVAPVLRPVFHKAQNFFEIGVGRKIHAVVAEYHAAYLLRLYHSVAVFVPLGNFVVLNLSHENIEQPAHVIIYILLICYLHGGFAVRLENLAHLSELRKSPVFVNIGIYVYSVRVKSVALAFQHFFVDNYAYRHGRRGNIRKPPFLVGVFELTEIRSRKAVAPRYFGVCVIGVGLVKNFGKIVQISVLRVGVGVYARGSQNIGRGPAGKLRAHPNAVIASVLPLNLHLVFVLPLVTADWCPKTPA